MINEKDNDLTDKTGERKSHKSAWHCQVHHWTTTLSTTSPHPLTDEERRREPGLFSLDERRLRGDPTTMGQDLKAGSKADGNSLRATGHVEKTRGDGYKLLSRRFQLDTNGTFLIMRTIHHQNSLPRKWWIPHHWTRLGFGWTGCWAIPSRQCLCKGLGQLMLVVSSNLIFYDSMV